MHAACIRCRVCYVVESSATYEVQKKGAPPALSHTLIRLDGSSQARQPLVDQDVLGVGVALKEDP